MISPEALRRYPYFAQLPDKTLKAIAMLSEERSFQGGQKVFEEGGAFQPGARVYENAKPAKCLMIVVKGEIDLTYRLASGREVVVGSIVPGDLMGVSSLIEPYQLTASGVARSDGSYICIRAEELREMCQKDHDLGYQLMYQLARALRNRLQDARTQLAGLS